MDNKYWIVRDDKLYTHDFNGGSEATLWTDADAKGAKYSKEDALANAQRIANFDGQSVDVVRVNEGLPTELYNQLDGKTVNPEDRFVTAYAVTRNYGGPEEGGWWYNAYHVLASIPLDSVTADEAKAFLTKAFAHIPEGNISSVLGGTELSVIAEWEQGSHQRPRPHYE